MSYNEKITKARVFALILNRDVRQLSQAVPATNYVTIKLVSLETYFIIKYRKHLYFTIIETFPQKTYFKDSMS